MWLVSLITGASQVSEGMNVVNVKRPAHYCPNASIVGAQYLGVLRVLSTLLLCAQHCVLGE